MLFAAVLFGRQTAATTADPIFLRFEVSLGLGLHVLSLRGNVEHSGEAYSIAAEAETRSLADLFVDLRSRLQVRGRIEAGALLPAAMRAETHRRGVDFYTHISHWLAYLLRPKRYPVSLAPLGSVICRGVG